MRPVNNHGASSSTQHRKELSQMDTTETQLKVEDEHLLQIPSLPQEVIADILSRLPVRSVCKFRCVSKLWLSITSDPFFAQAHLRKTLKDANFSSPSRRVLVSSHNLYSLNYESIGLGNEETVAQELDYPLKEGPIVWSELICSARDEDVRFYCEIDEDGDENPVMVKLHPVTAANPLNWVDILGSCNGLACIDVDEDALFLFNPTTGESKRIPDLGGEQKEEFLLSFSGFGYDEVHDDYKVVKLCSETGLIYSTRNDAWKRVVHGYEISYADQTGSFLDGAIHWVFNSKDEMGGCKMVVVVLDLATETFWDMPLPDAVEGGSQYSTAALNGCLCLLHSRSEMQDHFWVMTEYGVGESWTKVTISIFYVDMRPLCNATTGEMLLLVDGDLVLYNYGDQSSRKLVIRGIRAGACFEAHMCEESLISPNGCFRSHTYQVQK